MKPKLAIIGYGRLGRLAAHHLKKYFRVFVADRKLITDPEKGVRVTSVAAAAQKPIIVLSVPIRALRGVLEIIAPLVKPGTLVCDTCAAKQLPLQWMKRSLPRSVSILGTHPLFGPSSAKGGVAGKTVVVCPVRIGVGPLRSIIAQFERNGITVKVMRPSTHDRLIARSLFIAQYIGRALVRILPEDLGTATDNSKLLAKIVASARHDSLELFEDIYIYNRYTSSLPAALRREFTRLSRVLTRSRRKTP